MSYRVMAINPGSTSTKIAIFEGCECVFSENIKHDAETLKTFKEIPDQFDYRRDLIEESVKAAGQDISTMSAFVGRGGGLVSMLGGTYSVNDIMYKHAKECFAAKHPATLGPQLARFFAEKYGAKAFVVNPPDVDEFIDLARVTGIKGVYRESKIHALNQKEIALRYAEKVGRKYEDLNLIICHIGGGISITAHRAGRMIDSNDIVNGDGPMAPTRSGSVSVNQIGKLCFDGKHTYREINSLASKAGGLTDLLGTSDCRDVVSMIEKGSSYAKLCYDAMIYQCAKYVGSMAAALCGKVDQIICTGGVSYDTYVTSEIERMCSFIAPVCVMAGEFEMEALANGALRVLEGKEEALEYTGVPVWSGFDEDI